jgi:glycosyltransferase involved in cell wall biosynthesis
MLSIIIPTLDSERTLVATLAALVPGATSGLVTEVLIADGGSSDDTAAVADIAGCVFMAVEGALGRRLRAATAAARAPWLMYLRPGIVLDTPWTAETLRFAQQPSSVERAAVFRRAAPMQPAWREITLLLASALGARPSPDQGLIISKPFYEALGGHSIGAADAEADLISRIGRKRIMALSTRAFGMC